VEPDPAPQSEPPESAPPRRRRLLDPRAAGARLGIAAAVGIASMLLTTASEGLPWRVRAVVGWDAGALIWIALAWVMIARATPAKTRVRAGLDDPGRRFVFFLALTSSFFSLFAAVVVLKQIKSLSPEQVPVWTTLALVAVALSWVVTHTAFTLRYAHLYYRSHSVSKCFTFPGTDAPSDLDFAYFSFTVGMTFQVSDVVVTSSRARRAVLLHAVMAFVYNTTILALSLNLVTTLLG
jgi:uncharacterized membrane protein